MPKVKAKAIAEPKRATDGLWMTVLKFDRQVPKKGDTVTVKWGKVRSTNQNKLYWQFLTWLLEDCGLKDEYLTTEELHEVLKGRFLSKKIRSKLGFDILTIGSTTDLDKTSFAEYIDKVDKAMVQYCQIDTSVFWKEYHECYAKH